jgi:hypothetical protein
MAAQRPSCDSVAIPFLEVINSPGETWLVLQGKASQGAEKVVYFVIPSEARNLSFFSRG